MARFTFRKVFRSMLSARNKHSAIKIDVQMIYDFSVFFYVKLLAGLSLQSRQPLCKILLCSLLFSSSKHPAFKEWNYGLRD